MTLRHGLAAGCDEGKHVAMSRIGKTMRHPMDTKKKKCKNKTKHWAHNMEYRVGDINILFYFSVENI